MATEPQRYDLGAEESRDEALSRIKSYGTLTMSPELFEKLYLQPLGNVKGDLRKTLANPTPLGLIGFSVALTPLAGCLMGWRGAGQLGAANMYAVVVSMKHLSKADLVMQRSILLHWWAPTDHLRSTRVLPREHLSLRSVHHIWYMIHSSSHTNKD
jgi:hypothetical protein